MVIGFNNPETFSFTFLKKIITAVAANPSGAAAKIATNTIPIPTLRSNYKIGNVDLSDIFKARQTSKTYDVGMTYYNTISYKNIDLSTLYEKSTTSIDQIDFDTGFEINGVDFRYLFRSVYFYQLDVAIRSYDASMHYRHTLFKSKHGYDNNGIIKISINPFSAKINNAGQYSFTVTGAEGSHTFNTTDFEIGGMGNGSTHNIVITDNNSKASIPFNYVYTDSDHDNQYYYYENIKGIENMIPTVNGNRNEKFSYNWNAINV